MNNRDRSRRRFWCPAPAPSAPMIPAFIRLVPIRRLAPIRLMTGWSMAGWVMAGWLAIGAALFTIPARASGPGVHMAGGTSMLDQLIKFHAAYPEWHLLIDLFFASQIILIIVLFVVERRRRRAEKRTKKSEARFRGFAAISSDYLWETDAALRFSYFSSRVATIFGTHPAKMLGRTQADIGAPGADADTFAAHLRALADHKPFRNFVFSRKRPGGGVMWVSTSGEPVFDDAGAFLGYRGTGADITESINDKQALQKALMDAEQANAAKSQFLASMSHELRTPLNAILGFSDVLAEQYFGPPGSGKYREYAKDIRASGEHLLALVEDLLDVSALEAGKLSLTTTVFDIRPVADECLRTIRTRAEAKSLKLEAALADSYPGLLADRRAVKQIMLNLLSNAVKFTAPSGTIGLSITVAAPHIKIDVSDTGEGIPADQIETITEPFARGKDSAYISEPGWGLGLAISRSLVDLHDGRMEIDSALGRGTVMTVLLPLKAEVL